MGGGKSKSKSQQTTTVTTTNTTNIRDIGLTGETAVALADVIEINATERNMQSTNLIRDIAQGAFELSAMTIEDSGRRASENIELGNITAGKILDAAEGISNPDSSLAKSLPWIAAAFVGITAVIVSNK